MGRVHLLIIISAIFTIHGVLLPTPVAAELIREPVWAGKFYPADRAALQRTLRVLTRKAEQGPLDVPAGKTLKALVLPHAGYVYSGRTAAQGCRTLSGRHYRKVVLLGPDHRVGFRNGAISDAQAWQTPLGVIHLHPDAPALRKRSARFRAIPESDRTEHSLEVILPFLQHHLGDFKLVPIALGPGNIPRLASDVDSLLDDDTLLVVSSDLSHYMDYPAAVQRDQETIRMILRLDAGGLVDRENGACGKVPLLMTMDMAHRHGWEPVLVHYANSGDTAGGKDRVVGYAAIAFYGGDMKEESKTEDAFKEEEGRALIREARRTIGKRLGKQTAVDPAERAILERPIFDTRLGTFVTLTIDGNLRGCIGSLTAVESIRDGVRQNAINAAFRDPRFSPLTAQEFDAVDVEVSILTEPRPLSFKNPADLITKLRVDVDGVIIQKDGGRATFLPQVWEQLPRPEDFLSHLCMKAGLPANAWEKPGLSVFTYQVQYFEEKR